MEAKSIFNSNNNEIKKKMGMMHVVEHTLAPRTTGVVFNYSRGLRPPAGRMAPGLNGSLFGGASHSWPFRGGLGAENIHSQPKGIFPNGGIGLVLGLALGAAAGGLLLVMAVVAVLLKKWYGARPKGGLDFDMDDRVTISSSRSAPNTRSNSPDPLRHSKANLMRSITMDMISIETEMTSFEAVQPESPDDSLSYSGSMSTLHSQHLVSQQPERLNQAYEHDEQDDEPFYQQGMGQLAYQLNYDTSLEELRVDIIKAKHLPGRSPSNSVRDPFVKVSVLPDERNSQQTRVVRKTLEPVFNDSLIFQVRKNEIDGRCLRMSVYDIDRRRVRHTLGHAFVQLSADVIKLCDVCWVELQPIARPQNARDLGQIQLTLTVVPRSEVIHLAVSQVSGLTKLLLGRNEGIQISATLLHSSRPLICRRIDIVYEIEQQSQTTFNDILTFKVPIRQLDACRFEVKLEIVPAVLGRAQPPVEYGRVVVGSHLYTQGAGLNHWGRMVQEAGTAITSWHRIKQPSTPPNHS